jgi:hypothetical protein
MASLVSGYVTGSSPKWSVSLALKGDRSSRASPIAHSARRWYASANCCGVISPPSLTPQSSNTSSGSAADTSALGASTSSEMRSSAATLIST